MHTCEQMSLSVKIWAMPVEIPAPIRFEEDVVHHDYDPEAANRVWRILLQVARVFTSTRCGFIGKCSPVQFFWGSFDLAVTRFSGRPAPPRAGVDEMTREAYSHEVSSVGFWPGEAFTDAAFYAYTVPEPVGYRERTPRPSS